MPMSLRLCQRTEKKKGGAFTCSACFRSSELSLLILLCRNWHDIDTATSLIKQDGSIAQSEQCVIVAHTNISAGAPFGAALTSQNVTCDNSLATELLDSASLGFGIPTVAAGTLSLLMSHDPRTPTIQNKG
jgi:hypothetical protein